MKKILSLYVDKWYIVGAVIDDANKFPLPLSNAEERIWLYFYSNSTANAVKYSLSYRDDALEGKNGYYGDIFELLPEYKEYHYEKYGTCKDMKDIFADAGILHDLKKLFSDINKVPTFLSFSKDIDIVSQHIFIKTLEEEHFNILQYTLPIESLAIEYIERHGSKDFDDNYVLIVNACNENLLYSIYHNDDRKYTLLTQKSEPGYGVNSRKQAIVEEVLEYLQASTNFLTGEAEERHEEMLYLSQFTDNWLTKLDNSPSHAPVALGNIHFKKQVNNDVPVVIFDNKISDRTKNIIEKLSRKIVEMVKYENILLSDISQIIFLGDVFSNNTFVESLQKKIGIDSEQIVKFSESYLPEVVGIYSVWNDKMFMQEKADHVEAARKEFAKDRQETVEFKTSELKEKASIAEDECRLQDAINYYERVLRIDSKDEYSLARIPSIKAQIEQTKKNMELVNQLLDKAHQNIIANKFAEAILNCDEILRLQQDNLEAKHIKEESENAINRKRQLEIYIKRINELLVDDKFYDARNILQKIDSLNFNDSRLKETREKIETGIAQLQNKIKNKIASYDAAFFAHDYQLCLCLCNELLAIGVDSERWSQNKKKVEQLKEVEQHYKDNYELARKARVNGNWHDVIEYAEKANKIRKDEELIEWIDEANEKIISDKSIRIEEDFHMAYANKQWEVVITIYNENTFLHRKLSNSRMYTDSLRLRRNKIEKEPLSDNEFENIQRIEGSSVTPRPKGPHRRKLEKKPLSLLESQEANIEIKNNRKRFPAPKRTISNPDNSGLDKEVKSNEDSLESNDKKRKFPIIRRHTTK